jgi:hypothetical protein
VRRAQYSRDEEHLRILSILYYVFGGLGLFGGLFPLIYVAMGAVMVSGGMGPPGRGGPGGPPDLSTVGYFLIVIFGVISLLLFVLAGCALFTGYNLSRKKRYMFCFVDACICCIQVPLGTILGVFTIVVLARPGVKDLFEQGPKETLTAEAP